MLLHRVLRCGRRFLLLCRELRHRESLRLRNRQPNHLEFSNPARRDLRFRAECGRIRKRRCGRGKRLAGICHCALERRLRGLEPNLLGIVRRVRRLLLQHLELRARVQPHRHGRRYLREIVDRCLRAIAVQCRELRREADGRVGRGRGSRCVRLRAEGRAERGEVIRRVRRRRAERRIVLLSSGVGRCLLARGRGLVRPGGQACCRRCRMQRRLQRPSRASRSIHGSRHRVSVRAARTNASKKVSASCTRRVSVRDLAIGDPRRQ